MPNILHVELVEQTPTALELRLWRDNPNELRTRSLQLAEVAGLVGRAETEYYSSLPARLQEFGQSLFRWLDGGERWLSAEIAGAANQAPVLVLAISMPHGLAHLPWEVLHDGTGFLVHALNPPVLPVRWRNAGSSVSPAEMRPLHVLFMASSPVDVEPELNYEMEEYEILKATERRPIDLVVEESGSLEELCALVQDYGADFFDVLHLTGHADHADDDTPIFLLEDSEGRRADVSPLDLARELPHRPPLVFLSGCRTGQAAKHGEVRSFAEQLIASGFRAVLGWGRPVGDAVATLAAQLVYQQLAAGESLPRALVRAHAELQESGVRDWHLLRLFCAGDPPDAFVTPVRTPGRRRPVTRTVESEFLDSEKKVKVATRAAFVGRRRLLQQSLRELRRPEALPVGLLLQGQGGRGKSSVAARLCNRLLREFQRVVVIGRLDESSLINAWAPVLPDDAARQVLRDPAGELRYRIQATLEGLADAGRLPPLFVLDDFEQNQPNAADGDLGLTPHAAAVLLPLLGALEHTGLGRVLLTCRYDLPDPFADYLHEENVPPLDEKEQKKQSLRLEQKSARQTRNSDLLEQARLAADGNPRLFEWLHSVLEKPGLDQAVILAEMQQAEERFRENILARRLIASLPEEDRVLLGRMLMLNVPVPLTAVHGLDPSREETQLRAALERAAGLSLVDVTEEGGEPHYRVPRQLEDGDPPLLPIPDGKGRALLAGRVSDVLYGVWWTKPDGISEVRMLELVRLAAEAGRKEQLVTVADMLTTIWIRQYRYREAQSLLESIIETADRHHALLLNLAWAVGPLGHGDLAGELLHEAAERCPSADDEGRANILFHLARWLIRRGRFEEGLRILREERLPIAVRLGDARIRATTLGQIADVLEARGELDEALRIWREEQLPVFERLGDIRERALTLGRIADVLEARGELDEALRIRREEELPVYERLGDVKSRAITLGQIADVLAARGELEESLRIRSEEELPVYEFLGDVRARAVTLGKIADGLAARGELDEALRIRRDEQLPVFDQLGDPRERAITLGRIARDLARRGQLDEAIRIIGEEERPVYERLNAVRELITARVNLGLLLLKRGRDEDIPEAREHLLWGYLGAAQRGYREMAQIANLLRQYEIPLPE